MDEHGWLEVGAPYRIRAWGSTLTRPFFGIAGQVLIVVAGLLLVFVVVVLWTFRSVREELDEELLSGLAALEADWDPTDTAITEAELAATAIGARLPPPWVETEGDFDDRAVVMEPTELLASVSAPFEGRQTILSLVDADGNSLAEHRSIPAGVESREYARSAVPGADWYVVLEFPPRSVATGLDAERLQVEAFESVRGRLLTTILVAVLVVLGALALLLHLRLTVPVTRFKEDLTIVTRGNLDHQIVAGWNDELGALGDSFNEMTAQLKRTRDRLRDYNRTLERGVDERTEELARRNLELNRAYREKEHAFAELQATQSQMLLQERMATLGQLLAGIAHEINNPVNFMVNAIRPLENNVGKIQGVLQLLMEQYGDILGSTENSREGGVPDLPRIMSDIQGSVRLIRTGADRTARIVQNLRTFSRTQEGEFKAVDLTAGLDITLSLLAHLIKGRIEVVKEYEEVPPIECSPGEINQVFMNLLSNACQAIRGPGKLWVRVREKDGGVSVFIQDSGCGIPAELLGRIFEPFFTTKGSEVGTGLGLSITNNIVQKHGGRIEVASVEGETTEFEVWLPLRQDLEREAVGWSNPGLSPAGASEA